MLNKSGSLLDGLIRISLARATGLVRGYVAGLARTSDSSAQTLALRLDELEKENPVLSLQIAMAAGSRVRVFDRAIRLVSSGQVPAYNLRNFTFWAGDLRTTNEQAVEAIGLLMPLAPTDKAACDVMIDFMAARLHAGEFDDLLRTHKALAWKAMAIGVEYPGRETWWLARLLQTAAPTDQTVAIKLACQALVSNDFAFRDEAENLLSIWAATHPDEVMAGIGALMLDEKVGWHFHASKFRVFRAIKPRTVISWLESVGVQGARRIARHLPIPYIDASGAEVVPEVTEFVLSRFEDDDVTFREFCVGTHSFQLYWGDLAAQKEAEAAAVRPFLNHPLRRVREWARYEEQSTLRTAAWQRELDDELGL